MASGGAVPARKRRRSVDWSDLPPDILRLIGLHLTSIWNYIRFRGVCSTWRSAATSADCPYQIPSLLLPYDLSSTARSFFDPSDRRVRTVDLPESRNKWLYGTPYGWLVMIGTSQSAAAAYNVSLLNPITRAHLSLPLLDGGITGSVRNFTFVSPKPVLSADPSSSPKAFLAILTPRCRLGICRVGGEAWTWIDLVCCSASPHSLRRTISDIAYFDGAFYVVDIAKGITSISTSTLKKRYSVPPIKDLYHPFNLVESSGELLLIERSGVSQEIFKLDRSSRRFKWATLGVSIGDRALFVSKKHSSMSLPSSPIDPTGCQWRDVICSASDLAVDRKDALICISDTIAGRGVMRWPYYWHRSNRARTNEINAIGLTWIIPSLC